MGMFGVWAEPTRDPTRSMRGRARKRESAQLGVGERLTLVLGDGVALGAPGRGMFECRPLVMTLAATVAVTLAYRKQLAAEERRSSVKA